MHLKISSSCVCPQHLIRWQVAVATVSTAASAHRIARSKLRTGKAASQIHMKLSHVAGPSEGARPPKAESWDPDSGKGKLN
jgi:hypothetical protein